MQDFTTVQLIGTRQRLLATGNLHRTNQDAKTFCVRAERQLIDDQLARRPTARTRTDPRAPTPRRLLSMPAPADADN
jgi:hypothetical protein